MTPGFQLRPSALFLLILALSPLGYAQTPAPGASPANTPTVSAPATNASAASDAQAKATQQTLIEGFQLAGQGKLDAALANANSILQTDPKNMMGLSLRGNIYTEKKLWDLAVKDYQTMLQIDAKNSPARFNLAEIKFQQKDYDGARSGFVAMEKDADLGDLATFKVFLCDLFGGHEDVASKEFDAFNQVGGNPSYYFANVAWYLYHHKIEDARSWLTSAINIYSDSPRKINFYTKSLRDLGYLPIPAPPPK